MRQRRRGAVRALPSAAAARRASCAPLGARSLVGVARLQRPGPRAHCRVEIPEPSRRGAVARPGHGRVGGRRACRGDLGAHHGRPHRPAGVRPGRTVGPPRRAAARRGRGPPARPNRHLAPDGPRAVRPPRRASGDGSRPLSRPGPAGRRCHHDRFDGVPVGRGAPGRGRPRGMGARRGVPAPPRERARYVRPTSLAEVPWKF